MTQWRAAVAAWLLACSALPGQAQVQGQWTAAGAMHSPREYQAQASIAGGRLLVAGGDDGNGNVLASVELYAARTGAWTLSTPMAAARSHFPAVTLGSGAVLVEGGSTTGSALLASAEVFNARTARWSAAGTLSLARSSHTATLLRDGRVLVAGGCASADCAALTATAELYDPATNRWTPTGNLAVPRAGHTAVLLRTGQVLVVGGTGAGTSAELFDPATGRWSPAASTLVARLHHAAARLPDGRVLVTGGQSGRSPLASAEIYDPATNLWSVTGSMRTPRYGHSATLLPDGTVMVAGGEGQSVNCGRGCISYIPTANAETFTEATGSFAAAQPLRRALAYQSATLLSTGQLLVAGGLGTTTTCCIVVADAASYVPLTLNISSDALDFGFLQIGLTSPPQNVGISNVSTHVVNFTGITASGDYTQTSNCPAALAPGQNCTVTLSFSPSAAGARPGTLTLSDDSPGSPQQVIALSGMGEAQALGFSPAALDFGGVPAGSFSTLPATLINDSAAPVTVNAITITQKGSVFRQTNDCPGALAPQQRCTLQVTFVPPDVGNYQATLAVSQSAGGPVNLALTGTGLNN